MTQIKDQPEKPEETPKKDSFDHRRQFRAWCFTMWTREDAEKLQNEPNIKAIVIGEETCPKTNKIHFQGYVRFATNKRFKWWKDNYPTAHVEPRSASEVDAAAYCRKDHNVIVDRGCQVVTDTGGTETEAVLNLMEAGAPYHQIYKQHRVFFFRNISRIEHTNRYIKRFKEDNVDYRPNPDT